jgi:predicted TIM-barrel fold metal-dependent hydrolase
VRIIDAHAHVAPRYAELAVRAMDRSGIERCVTHEWHDGFGPTLVEHLAVFARYPGRFTVFGNVDWSRINEPGFGALAADMVRRDAESGMRGIKVFKALGLGYRQPDGSLWRVNDERLDPVWAAAGEVGIPILLHVADPPEFWRPVNDANFWNGVLYGEYAWWAYYRAGFPSPDELLAERNEVIARHPSTLFICPHVGSNSHNLDQAADDLEALPNLVYDIAARIPELGIPGRRRDHARAFLIEHQDRVLFGTDVIYDTTNVPTGIQAQSLYQPGEILLDGADPEERYVETTVAFVDSHLQFLATDADQVNPPFRRSRPGYAIRGLGLPEAVVEKILWRNAERVIGRA